ncbi:MAG: arginine--tRNA ligase [Thermoplasmatota archaeon]
MDDFRSDVLAIIAPALAAHGLDAPSLETPPDATMGDLGMPCFGFAKAMRKSPVQIASELADAMQATGWVTEVRAVGPYVNFFMDKTRLAKDVLCDPVAAVTADAKPRKILLEHTSANPNGPLHVGRARNPILGDTMARLFRLAGHDTETQYYMDNLGRQVAQLYWGKVNIPESELPPTERNKPDHDLVRYYQAANERRESDPAVAEEIKNLVAELETAPPELVAKVRPVYEACFSGMRQSLERLGVTYDSIKDESDLVDSGAVEEVIAGLKQSSRWAQEEDGANYLDMSAELEGNKSTKFFFTRKDQTSVYATRDVAYHHWKAQQVGEGRLVNVLGEDHRLQSLQVSVALEELGYRRPDVIFYAFVSLPEGKMSTRANRVVFVDDLLDEAVAMAKAAVTERRPDMPAEEADEIAEAVGIGAIRFNIAKVQPEKPIKFRWEDALDFDGDSAPYIMYAYARACRLLESAPEAPMDVDLIGEGEAKLAEVISRLPATAESSVDDFAPHRFCAYASELASAFNEYYRDHPVLQCEDEALRAVRIHTVRAAQLALGTAMDALGIPKLHQM